MATSEEQTKIDQAAADLATAQNAVAAAQGTADQAAADKAKGVTGVATDAVAAGAAGAAAQRKAADAATSDEPVVIQGGPGAFAIYGRGFGGDGSLVIGGHVVKTTSWTDTRIKGELPEGVKGDVVLTSSSGVRRGVYPTPKAGTPNVQVEVKLDGKTISTATK